MATEKDPKTGDKPSFSEEDAEKAATSYRKIIDDMIDEQIDQSFPASDPPSYSEPGNDDLKPGRQDIRKGHS